MGAMIDHQHLFINRIGSHFEPCGKTHQSLDLWNIASPHQSLARFPLSVLQIRPERPISIQTGSRLAIAPRGPDLDAASAGAKMVNRVHLAKIFLMSKTAKQLRERVASWPEEDQEELAQIAREIEAIWRVRTNSRRGSCHTPRHCGA
jgi:hypothetical protein